MLVADVSPVALPTAPLGQSPAHVRLWFDDAAQAAIPDHDETIDTARLVKTRGRARQRPASIAMPSAAIASSVAP